MGKKGFLSGKRKMGDVGIAGAIVCIGVFIIFVVFLVRQLIENNRSLNKTYKMEKGGTK